MTDHPSSPAQEQPIPDAWQARDKVHGGIWRHCDYPHSNPDFEYRPLYAALSQGGSSDQKSAPAVRSSLPSGESDPSVTLDCAGADTAYDIDELVEGITDENRHEETPISMPGISAQVERQWKPSDEELAGWARNWHWNDCAEDKPVDPSIYFRDMRMLKAYIAKASAFIKGDGK